MENVNKQLKLINTKSFCFFMFLCACMYVCLRERLRNLSACAHSCVHLQLDMSVVRVRRERASQPACFHACVYIRV